MGLVNLEIIPRSTKGKNENRRLRAAGRIPAVVYGKERESQMFELEARPFTMAMTQLAGRAAIFSLAIGEATDDDAIALLREVQRNPCTDEILHVDLMEIPRGRPVTVAVAVQVVGECVDVKSGEAAVAMSLQAVEISCLPRELPEYITIDISELEINDKVFVRDIVVPVGEVITDPEILVLNIKPQAMEVEEEEEEILEGEEGAEGESEEGSEGDEDKKDKKED
jgi:large subunit ribosomal protein L25